jgi:MFS family permease
MSSNHAVALPVTVARRAATAFWIVAFAFLIVMAFATLPSPLYGLYRARDHLSALTITIVYAIFAGGVIAALLLVPAIARRIGRRGVMLAAVATMIASAALLVAWKALAGLLVGRLSTGVAVGLVAGTATTYLIELRVRQDPNGSIVRARNIGTSVNVGALGLGPLVAGCLAQWATRPLTVPYLLFIVLGVIALIGLSTAPETGTGGGQPGSSLRSARVPVPAAAATVAAFSANGLFAGLAGLFLATTLGHPSHALAGATLFVVFSMGVAAQLSTTRWPAPRVLALGTVSMLIGLALLVTAVRLSSPSLALFLIAGGLIGAGAGAVFKGTTGLVLEAARPEQRLAMTSQLLIGLFIGLSIPVVGAGIALDQGASAQDTVLGFAILVGLGVAGAGWALLGRRPHRVSPRERPVRSAASSEDRSAGSRRS